MTDERPRPTLVTFLLGGNLGAFYATTAQQIMVLAALVPPEARWLAIPIPDDLDERRHMNFLTIKRLRREHGLDPEEDD